MKRNISHFYAVVRGLPRANGSKMTIICSFGIDCNIKVFCVDFNDVAGKKFVDHLTLFLIQLSERFEKEVIYQAIR